MRVATFGSCLSRYTANNYVYLFGGKVVSSVYHNRSDAFVGRFIKGTMPHLNSDDIESMLPPKRGDVSIENKPEVILANQYTETIGLHRLSRGIQFLDLIKSKSVDILILDNYIDISARLMTIEGIDPEAKWFIRPRDIKFPHLCSSGELLSPEDGVANMLTIIETIKRIVPQVRLVFINFPYNTYEATSPERVQRTQEYEKLMLSQSRNKGFEVIPCVDVPVRYQTKDRQHFAKEMYCGYAGMIKSLDFVR